MHELSIALGIIDGASEEAQRHGARSVHAVHMRLGALAGVVKPALESAFELAREGTMLAGARLDIEDVPAVVHCPACQCDHVLTSLQCFTCPACGSPAAEVVAGRDLEITAVEITTLEIEP
jgi:hydrogenase nickel incorporation protein HypA/HybF